LPDLTSDKIKGALSALVATEHISEQDCLDFKGFLQFNEPGVFPSTF